ncbi:hypothetical protein ONS95_009755 [Cadophora gregata]|uniref:uncharacterized protein n=1 Tax=Cadophora gregata TaxID=51156 RepID=UPI0026DD0FD2|nr:uncharacterized protein ONS95_009755 [Cadophora gregata]KAK0121461.1 hypothetical protein ONS95_009755 [Cadophora gregata]KAK0126933.1 hypothetical protein ONS96_006496 [Cadophora gregata f. sp. sojae]
MTQNGTDIIENKPCSWPPVDMNASPFERRDWVANDEDHACAELDHMIGQQHVRFASWGAVCRGTRRRIRCRAYTPDFMNDPEDTIVAFPDCTGVYTCREEPLRLTTFGDEKPSTSCVVTKQLSTWSINKGLIGEKCLNKFRYPSAGTVGKSVRFHTWAWDQDTGIYTELKWMYIKVNGAYVRSTTRVSNWTVTYGGIKDKDVLGFCGTPWPLSVALTLMGQGTVLQDNAGFYGKTD